MHLLIAVLYYYTIFFLNGRNICNYICKCALLYIINDFRVGVALKF